MTKNWLKTDQNYQGNKCDFAGQKDPGFVPVTPSWLTPTTTTRTTTVKTRETNPRYQSWHQNLFHNRPILTQVQRPVISSRRPKSNIVTVKHGIFPNRYRYPRKFFAWYTSNKCHQFNLLKILNLHCVRLEIIFFMEYCVEIHTYFIDKSRVLQT